MQRMAQGDQRRDALEEVDRAQSPDGFGLERIGREKRMVSVEIYEIFKNFQQSNMRHIPHMYGMCK